ncbi:single-stranded DNA-binding protein [Candidatus Saganbacteria bacterium]|nr:single-stranded DNA-binding protein [Candidatus Saganbacteria bacterium]
MYNKVFLVGNLARDAEVRYTPAGLPVAKLTLAVNRQKKKDGSVSEADFIPLVAWRKLAEICGEYLKKGMPIAVEGNLQVRSFKGRDGQDRTMAEVVIDNMQMLGSKKREGSSENKSEEAPF